MELIAGSNPIIPESFSPMAIRFFMLQSHYRSTLDLTHDALKAAEKGLSRLRDAYGLLAKLQVNAGREDLKVNQTIQSEIDGMYEDMSNDFNTSKTIARLFELASIINIYYNNPQTDAGLNEESIELLQKAFDHFLGSILGIRLKDDVVGDSENFTDGLMEVILELRAKARENKDWPTSDLIRDKLSRLDIQVKDGKDGVTWSIVK